jgi:outer membrane protein OmpA-like peptidoglycan-associated protein
MRRQPLLVAAVLVAAVSPAAAPPAAATWQEQDTSGMDMASFILDIERTILDLEAGTGTTQSAVETTITLEADVFFDFDEHTLRPDARDTLAGVADQIREDGAVALSIEGHTDAVGSDTYNQDLSERRAATVKDLLSSELDGVRMRTKGFGSTQPVAPNETEDGKDNPEGRALNRRVEITYVQ